MQEEKYAYLKYVGHIAVMTGKIREAMSLQGLNTISDLISKLNEKYPGLEEVFMPPDGIFNSRTGIIIRRSDQASFGIINEDERIEDDDILTFW